MSEKKINTKEGTELLTILEGQAIVQQKPNEISISNGAIDAPADFLEHKPNYKGEFSHVQIDFEKGEIVLSLNEKDSNGLNDTIKGSLIEHDLVKKMDINTGNRMNKDELIDLVRFNRAYFNNPVLAGEIITQLRNFVATVTKRIESSDDQRGNTKSKLEAAIKDLKLEKNFKIKIPLFKGIPDKTELDVEIYVDTSSNHVQFYLISDDLFVLLIEERARLLKEQIERFEEFKCSIVKVY